MTAFLVAVLVFLLASCMVAEPVINPSQTPGQPTQTPAPSPTPSPTATPKSAEQIIAEMEAEIELSIRDNMTFDVASLLPQGEDPDRFDINLFNQAESHWILSIWDEVSGVIEAAVAQAESSVPPRQEVVFNNQLTAPDWQYLYMLLHLANGDAVIYGDYIKSSLSIKVNAKSGDEGTTAEVSVEPVYYRDAIRAVTGSDRLAYLYAESVHDYMNTVFDENLDEKKYVLPPAEGNLATGLTWPLKRYIRLRKSWYAPRDNGARKHTGTDIWAREGTEIYSCTAGTVFFVGYWGGGGNTVAVLDDYGYFFYYHHMVSIPDFLQEDQRVEAGQLIGHVGNTGNSARDHLHLSIIHPDGFSVNPYTYLKKARP